LLIFLAAVLMISAGVYAWNTTNPWVFGHDINELVPPSCSGDGYINYKSGTWTCKNMALEGAPTPPVCTGTNRVLQWTGSSWYCRTLPS